jgi:glutamate--cysteine ligase regulatory subunit
LTTSLRSNFISARETANAENAQRIPFRTWTTQEGDSLHIPSIDPSGSGLLEERTSYDITVKLFYLPNIPPSRRCAQTKEAVNLVLQELKVDKIDLLIVSFPNIVFDADDESEDEQEFSDGSSGDPNAPEDIATMLQTWQTIEGLHEKGIVDKLGLAEFGTGRLTRILAEARVRPTVDQINVRDCCVVPKPLILFAKKEGIDLLTHSDCTNILPRGTLRELLGPGEKGVGVLAAGTERQNHDVDGLTGDIEPQWVIKYTAVVKNRGVVENKGYFAVAELKDT